MGLASTQARLLSLTARQHAVEYEAQRVEAQKLQLANESDRVYSDYLAALDATKVQYKVVDDSGAFMFMDATFANLAEAGYIFNVEGEICENYEKVKEVLSSKGIVDLTANDSYSVLSSLVAEGLVLIMQQQATPESGYSFDISTSQIIYSNDLSGNPESFETHDLTELDERDNKLYAYKVFENTNIASSTKIQEVSDEVALKKIEAIYEADMNRINSKDARYDTELSQLETERNAIKTEIETLEQVAKDNVDRTFKLFG